MKTNKAKVAVAVFGLLAVVTALAQPVQREVVNNLLVRGSSGAGMESTMVRGRATLPTCATSASNPPQNVFSTGDVVLLNQKAGTNEPGWYLCQGGTWKTTALHIVGFGQLDDNLQGQIAGSVNAFNTTLSGTTLALYDNNGTRKNIEFVTLLGEIGPTTVRDKLQTLSGANRLDASAVKNLSDGQVISDGTLDGSGTSASPLEVANPFSGADEALLDFVGNLRKATALGTVNIAQNVGDSIGPGNITNIALPSANEGDVVSIVVTGGRTGTASFPLATLLAKTAATTGATVGDANSVTFADNAGDDIHVLRTATHFIFVLDGPGWATFAVTRLAFDVANFARPSRGVGIQRNDLAANQRIPVVSDGQALFGNSSGTLVARAVRDVDLAGLPSTANKSAASAGDQLVLNAGKTGYQLQTPRVLPTPFTTGKPLVATGTTAAAWQDVGWAAVGDKPVATQAQAESGLGTTPLLWSQQRIAQAIAARETATLPAAAHTMETLVDWTPAQATRPNVTGANAFTELPAAAAFSRMVTSSDDDRLMVIELAVGENNSSSASVVWSTPLVLPARVWRELSTTAGGANPASAHAYFVGTQIIGRTSDYSQRLIVGKGVNGRVGLSSQRSAAYVYRLRVHLMAARSAMEPKGALLATSSNLPTVAIATARKLNVGWTLASGLSTQYRVHSNAFLINPGLPPNDGQLGFVCEVEVAGVLVARSFLGWGPAGSDSRDAAITSALHWAPDYRVWGQLDIWPSGQQALTAVVDATKNAFPANTVMKIYEWLDAGGGGLDDTNTTRTELAQIMNKASTDAMRFDYNTAIKNVPPATVAQKSGNAFPTNPVNGEKFKLLADLDLPQWAKLTLAADSTRVGWASSTDGSDLLGVSNARMPGVRTIARGISGIGANLLNRVYVTIATANSKTPSKLIVHNATTGANASYAVTAVPAISRFYRTATNPIAPAWAASDIVYTNVEYSDGTKELPNLDRQPSVYAWNADRQVWQEALGLHTYAEIDAHVRSNVLMAFADRANFAKPGASRSLIPRILLPRPILIGRATDQQLAYLRNAGDNTWTDPSTLANTQIGGIKKDALPAGAECYFILQVPSRTGKVWSDRFHCDEFRSFPDATWDRALTSSAVRVRREIMSSQDALFDPAADRSSYRATLRGQVVLWLGWKVCGSETCLVARSDHAAYWVAGSTIELWAAPLG